MKFGWKRNNTYQLLLRMPTRIKDCITECIVVDPSGESYVVNTIGVRNGISGLTEKGKREIEQFRVELIKKGGDWFIDWPTTGFVSNYRSHLRVPFDPILLKYINTRYSRVPKSVIDELVHEAVIGAL